MAPQTGTEPTYAATSRHAGHASKRPQPHTVAASRKGARHDRHRPRARPPRRDAARRETPPPTRRADMRRRLHGPALGPTRQQHREPRQDPAPAIGPIAETMAGRRVLHVRHGLVRRPRHRRPHPLGCAVNGAWHATDRASARRLPPLDRGNRWLPDPHLRTPARAADRYGIQAGRAARRGAQRELHPPPRPRLRMLAQRPSRHRLASRSPDRSTDSGTDRVNRVASGRLPGRTDGRTDELTKKLVTLKPILTKRYVRRGHQN